MNKRVFIPKELHVGYQNRSDTYTGKLAYVIYTDDKGKLRKETSWNSWRSKDIEPSVFENVPTEGFVLNKKAGDYKGSWDGRMAWCRVYDPRGFEFEISINNLLYILDNANSLKGKGLEGEFVYGWDGTELLLIPVGAPDYQEYIEYRDTLYDKTTVKASDLKVGATYLHKNGTQMVYTGKFRAWTEPWDSSTKARSKGDCHFFVTPEKTYKATVIMKSLGSNVIKMVDEGPHPDFIKLVDYMESQLSYAPIDQDADQYPVFTMDEWMTQDRNGWIYHRQFYSDGKRYSVSANYRGATRNEVYYTVTDLNASRPAGVSSWNWKQPSSNFDTLEEVYHQYRPCHRDKYLVNGKKYRREC